MLDPKLSTKLNQAYARLGEMGYEIALRLRQGKDFTTKQREAWEKAIKLWTLLKILFRHVDITTTPPTLYKITEEEVNRLIRCLDKIGGYDKLPVTPSIFGGCKPKFVFSGGQSGQDGAPGTPGSDANINLQLTPGEIELELTQSVVSGVKTYTLGFEKYTAPSVQILFDEPQIHQQGESIDKNISIISTKGSENVTAISIFDAALNPLLQAILNLPTVNGPTQPVTNTITHTLIGTQIVQVTITDGITPIIVSKTLPFVYPILYGSNANTSINYYTSLNKLIEAKGTKLIPLNGDEVYFFIAVVGFYGEIKIFDHNDIEVTQEFTLTDQVVSSSGLDLNWGITYKLYRTTDKTTINNRLFRIEFQS